MFQKRGVSEGGQSLVVQKIVYNHHKREWVIRDNVSEEIMAHARQLNAHQGITESNLMHTFGLCK